MRKSVIAAVVAALSVLMSAAARPAEARAELPPHVFTNADVGFWEQIYQPGDPGPRLDREKAYAGARTPIVRVDLDWFWLQHDGPAAVDFAGIDKTVDAAHARGFRVLLILGYAPSWANGGQPSGKFFPTRAHDAAWATIVRETVAHFAGKVQAYEIWNEPNQEQFGDFAVPGTPAQRLAERKKRYWELVKLAHPVIKAGCPGCVVLAGGSAHGTPNGTEAEAAASGSAAWLQAGYDHGARAFFDAVAHHPYYGSFHGPTESRCDAPARVSFGLPYRNAQDRPCGQLAALRQVLERNGDTGKKIWGTEWGIPTRDIGRTGDPLTHIRNLQVDSVRLWRSVPWTGPLFLYQFQDSAGCDHPDAGLCHFGVVTRDSTPKSPLYEDLSAAFRGVWPDRLHANQSLPAGAQLWSADGRFALVMQHDGNLVLYRRPTATAPQKALWATGTTAGYRLVNQADGLLQLMNKPNVSIWNNRSYQGQDRRATLVLQNDGNLVLTLDATRRVIWDSKTWQ